MRVSPIQLPLLPRELVEAGASSLSGEEGIAYHVSDLTLELPLTSEDRAWCVARLKDQHYLHRDIFPKARPFYYLVRFRGERAGVLVYGRMHSSRCKGWYGTLEDIERGWAPSTQWEFLCLMRMWLDPRVQSGGDWYVPNAASYLIAQSLKRVHYEYLRAFPPPFPDEPWKIHTVISYCDPAHHRCSLYLAANFRLARTNRRGLRTYARPMPPLTPEQERLVLLYARLNERVQEYREEQRAEEHDHQPAILRRRRCQRKVA